MGKKAKNIAAILLPVLLVVTILVPDFKAIFAIIGLLGIAYIVVEQKEHERNNEEVIILEQGQ